MSFTVVVKVDTSQALPAVKGVEQGLDKTASSASKLGDTARTAMNDAKVAADAAAAAAKRYSDVLASGLAKTSMAAAKAREEAERAAGAAAEAQRKAVEAQREIGAALARAGDNAFGALTNQFERERDVLERMRAPMREYHADLVALDALHRRGAITTSEFADEMERLTRGRRAAQTAQAAQTIGLPSAPEAAGPGIGSGLRVVAGAAAGLGIYEGLGKLREIVEHFQFLADTYIAARNAAVKFADASHDVTRIMNEQLLSANALNSSYHTTIAIYDTVRDGIDDLSFSHREQIRLVETVGKAAQIAGRSLGSVGGIVERLAYAAARGSIEQRELNSIMRAVPDIAQLWTEKFGVGRKELINLVQQGKVSTTDLIESLVTNYQTVDQNFKKISRTARQELALIDEKIGLFISKGDSYANAIRKALDVNQGLAPVDYQGFQGMMDFQRGLRKTWADLAVEFSDRAEDIAKAAERAGDAIFRKLVKSLVALNETVPAALGVLKGLGDQLLRATGIGSDPWGSDKTGFGAQVRLMERYKAPIEDAKLALQTLHALQQQGALSAEQYRKEYNALVTTINDGRLPEAIRIWEALNDPIRDHALTVSALNALYRAGRIDVAQYNAELGKVAAATAASVYQDVAQAQATRGVPVGGRDMGGVAIAVGAELRPEAQRPATSLAEQSAALRSTTPALREYNDELTRQFAIAGQLAAPQLAYEERLGDINRALNANMLTQRQAARLTEQAGEAYETAQNQLAGYADVVERYNGPAKDYERGLRKAADALEDGKINADQYAQEVDRVRAAYLATAPAGKEFAGTLESAFLKSKLEAESFGQTLAQVVTGSVDKLNESIVSMAHGGEIAWGKMVDSMIQDLERLLIKQLEIAAINALITAATGGVPVPGAGQAIVGSGAVPDISARSVGAYPTPTTSATFAASSTQGTTVVNKIVNVLDRSEIYAAMESPQGERTVVNTIRRNAPAIRSSSGTRR